VVSPWNRDRRDRPRGHRSHRLLCRVRRAGRRPGEMRWPGGRALVRDTQKDGAGRVLHEVEVVQGALREPFPSLELQVSPEHRLPTQRNHTATHLLHGALRQVLGEGVRQAGSLVHPDHLRFDFTFGRPLTAEERGAVESLVDEWVLRAVDTRITPDREFREAVAAGAMALFGEKYGERVRTVEVPGFSLELCGGCHVRNTGEIGPFVIRHERGIASGVRRIEALTGGGRSPGCADATRSWPRSSARPGPARTARSPRSRRSSARSRSAKPSSPACASSSSRVRRRPRSARWPACACSCARCRRPRPASCATSRTSCARGSARAWSCWERAARARSPWSPPCPRTCAAACRPAACSRSRGAGRRLRRRSRRLRPGRRQVPELLPEALARVPELVAGLAGAASRADGAPE